MMRIFQHVHAGDVRMVELPCALREERVWGGLPQENPPLLFPF